MKFLVRATIPTKAGNALVHNPNFGSILENVLGDIKPETAYFAVENGQRTMYLVVNVDHAHQTPGIAEPLWLALEAQVDFIPAMGRDEFAKATPSIEKAAKKY